MNSTLRLTTIFHVLREFLQMKYCGISYTRLFYLTSILITYIYVNILAVVHFSCATLSVILREKCRIRVFENRVLRRVFGLKWHENGEWKRLHNEERHSLYRSPNSQDD